MSTIAQWGRRVWYLLNRRRLERELDREMASHRGLMTAPRRFGSTIRLREESADVWGWTAVDDLRHDLRYGARMLRRSPGFTAAAIITVAIGIGASTAIFTLFDAVMLRRLSIQAPDELYFVGHGPLDRPRLASNRPYVERIRTRSDVFAGIATYTRSSFKVTLGDRVEIAQGQYVSANYHAVLRIAMSRGRGFTSVEERTSGGPLEAVISDGYWARVFGRDAGVVGRTMMIDGRSMEIIGVTAAGFDGLEPGAHLDVTLPLAVRLLDTPDFASQGSWMAMPIVARRQPTVSEAQAAAAVESVFQQYFSEPENVWLRQGIEADQFRASLLLRADRGTGGLRNQYAPALRVLMAMVGVVLLIACVNVANLLLARGMARANEVAVRMSLGAGRARLIRQFLAESALLALIGGVLGFALARIGVAAMASLVAVGPTPIVLDTQPNASVLAFAMAVSVVTALLSGLAPAFGTTRVDLTPALKQGGTAGRWRGRGWPARRLLVAGQIALSVLLVASAGLLAGTVRNLETRSRFEENVLMFSFDVRGTSFPAAQLPRFCQDVVERFVVRTAAVSGSCSRSVPVQPGGIGAALEVPGTPPQPAAARGVFVNRVTPDYFRTFGIGIAGGRIFDSRDTATSAKVAIVSRALVRYFFGSDNPIGRTIQFPNNVGSPTPMTIVGIVEDAVQQRLREELPRTVYLPLTQPLFPAPEPFVTVALRYREDPGPLVALVHSEVRALSADVVIDYIRTMEQQIDAADVRERLLATLSGVFGALALLLSCIGLYGVMSYDVSHRMRDLGIRIALGARRSEVLRGVLRGALSLSCVGVLGGLIAALAATRVLTSLLFGISARDPLTLASAATLMVLTALTASYLPARRAARTNPLLVLRAD